MTDQNSQFFAILTEVGEAKQANANALGVPWTFSQMGVGDANNIDPTPSRTQTTLINERRRAPLNQIKVDPTNASIIIAEQVIPPDVGGWWIREIGLYDAAGDLVAVANCAPTFKPLLTQGTGKTQVVRLNIVVTSTANVELKIDPAVVLATRTYVDASILAVLPPNKVAGTYAQVRVDSRGVVQQGFNPTTLAGHGITDAYTQAQTDSKLLLKANLASPAFTGAPTVPDVAAGTSSGQAANTKFVVSEIARLVASSPAALDTLNELAAALGNDPNFAATMTTQLAGKMAKGAGGLLATAPVVAGALADIAETQFVSVANGTTTDKPVGISYGTGFHIKYPGSSGEKYAFEMISGMTNEWYGVRMIGPTVAGSWRELYHDGNFNPALKANLASPAFTGLPTAPTAAKGTSTTQMATCAFVAAWLADKADKATTLGGYGIGDAMEKGAGGLMTASDFVRGKIADLDATQFITFANLASDKPAAIDYGVGIHVKYPTAKYSLDFVGSVMSDVFGARYTLGDGTSGAWRYFWHDGNFTPALKANLASPSFTGTVAVPDVAAGTSNSQAANTKFVMSAIASLVASSPAALDTLNELAAALGNDPNFAATMTTQLAGKMTKGAGGLMATPAVVAGALADLAETQFVYVSNGTTTDKPTSVSYGTGFHIKCPGNPGEKYAFEMISGVTNEWFGVRMIGPTVAGAWRELYHDGNFNPSLKANLAGPTFSGVVSVPDVSAGTSNSQAANTRFVASALASQASAASPAQASAWVNFDGVTMAIKGSHNVSSVTDNGVGMYTVNLLAPLANTNYAAEVAAPGSDGNWRGFTRGVTGGAATTKTTSALSVGYGGGGYLNDSPDMSVLIFGGK